MWDMLSFLKGGRGDFLLSHTPSNRNIFMTTAANYDFIDFRLMMKKAIGSQLPPLVPEAARCSRSCTRFLVYFPSLLSME